MVRYTDGLYRSLAVLSGKIPESFDQEVACSRFQFKVWLRTSSWPGDCFRQYGLLFSAARLTRAMQMSPNQLLQEGKHRISPSEAMIKGIKKNRSLIDATFGSRDMTEIPTVSDYAKIVSASEVNRSVIDDLNAWTRWRLRIGATKGIEATVNRTWMAYEAFERKNEGRRRRTVLLPMMSARESRMAFLFAAKDLFPEILDIGDLDYEVGNGPDYHPAERWRAYCEGVLYVMSLTREENLEKFRRSIGLDAKAWCEFEPLSDDEQDTAGITPDGRRSATETRRAKRKTRGSIETR